MGSQVSCSGGGADTSVPEDAARQGSSTAVNDPSPAQEPAAAEDQATKPQEQEQRNDDEPQKSDQQQHQQQERVAREDAENAAPPPDGDVCAAADVDNDDRHPPPPPHNVAPGDSMSEAGSAPPTVEEPRSRPGSSKSAPAAADLAGDVTVVPVGDDGTNDAEVKKADGAEEQNLPEAAAANAEDPDQKPAEDQKEEPNADQEKSRDTPDGEESKDQDPPKTGGEGQAPETDANDEGSSSVVPQATADEDQQAPKTEETASTEVDGRPSITYDFVREYVDGSGHQDLVLIDVRASTEFVDGHIPRALNAPLHLMRPHVVEELVGPEKDRLIIFSCCRSGFRAEIAAKVIGRWGYDNVRTYPGGFDDWVENSGRIEK